MVGKRVLHAGPIRRSVGSWAIEPSPASCARRCLEPVAATSEITPRAARRLRPSEPRARLAGAADAGDRARVRAVAGRATRQHRRPGPLGDGRLPRRSGLVRRGRRRRHRAAPADDHAHRDGVRQRHQDRHRRARAATRRAGRARARRSDPPLVPGAGAATGRRRCATCWAIPPGPPTRRRSASKRSCAIHGATSRGASWRRHPSPVPARAKPCTRTRASSSRG